MRWRPASVPPRRTLPFHDTKSEIDDRLLRPAALDRFDHHHGSVPAHFITVGAYAGQGWDGAGHEFEVVEADDRHLLRNRHVPALTFEQCAQCDVVISAEHGLDVRSLGQQVGKQRTTQCDRTWRSRCDNTSRIEQGCIAHRGLIAVEPPLHPWIHAGAEESDAPIALFEKGGRYLLWQLHN